MNLLPAVIIGGPPHSGKSVLAYSLSRALRQRDVPHYVLRAYPDGEGDWANQADQALVRAIRIKGYGSSLWVQRIRRDIERRHLPLIVDVGGKPTPDQETIFDQCSHAVLLTPDDASRKHWLDMLARHSLLLIADLRSDLEGINALDESGPILHGALAGLERGQTASGPTFEALVERFARLFAYPAQELRRRHHESAPVELVLELQRLGRTLDALDEHQEWLPQHLPSVLDYLPQAVPLGLYDRAPNWLYAALALFAHPAPLYQFDVRLGWISPPQLRLGQPPPDAPLQISLHPRADHVRAEVVLTDKYLDYEEAEGLYALPIPADQGLVLSGQLPLWLWTALALVYRAAPWLGIYQPRLGDRAVVVKSTLPALLPGQLVSSPPPCDTCHL